MPLKKELNRFRALGNMNNKTLFLLVSLLFLTACSSVTIRPYGGEKDTSPPDYQSSKTFYLAGIIGEHEVNTSAICGQRRVMQMQAITSLSDWLQSMLTLLIYTPRTAKVWCEHPSQESEYG